MAFTGCTAGLNRFQPHWRICFLNAADCEATVTLLYRDKPDLRTTYAGSFSGSNFTIVKANDNGIPGRAQSAIKTYQRSKRAFQRSQFATDETWDRMSSHLQRDFGLQFPRESELQALTPELPAPSTSLHVSEVSSELLVGDTPRCLEDVDAIAAAGAKALIVLEDEEADRPLDFDWDELTTRAAAVELVTSKIYMSRQNFHDQAMCLPEAVKIVTALAETGHRVYLCEAEGTERSSLVALGFLTFAQGMDLKDATKHLFDSFPTANPAMAAWEEARSRLLSGQSARVTKMANELNRQRRDPTAPGAAAEDWLKAQRLVLMEQFQRGVSTQVYLAEAMRKISYLRGKRLSGWQAGKQSAQLKEGDQRVIPVEPSPSVGSQLLLELGIADEAVASIGDGGEEQALPPGEAAMDLVRARVRELKQAVAAAQMSEEEARSQNEAAKESLARMKGRVDALLKQVVSERTSAAMADTSSSAAKAEVGAMAKQLEVSRKKESEVRAESAKQISALQKGLTVLQKELVAASKRIGDLEKSIEEEKTSADEKVKNIEQEAAEDREQKVDQVAASFRKKIEEEAAQHREELEKMERQHLEELELAKQQHKRELEHTESSYRASLEAMQLADGEEQAARRLSQIYLHNENLADQLEDAQDCMTRMADELEYLQTRVLEDKLNRETQIEEELKMLRTAQAHVDRLAAEKGSTLKYRQLAHGSSVLGKRGSGQSSNELFTLADGDHLSFHFPPLFGPVQNGNDARWGFSQA